MLRHGLRLTGKVSSLLLTSVNTPVLALAAWTSAGFEGIKVSMTGKGTVDESAKAGQVNTAAVPLLSASASCAAAAAMAGCRVAKAAAAASAFVCKDALPSGRHLGMSELLPSITLLNKDEHCLETQILHICCVCYSCCVNVHLLIESRGDLDITCALPSQSEPSGASELLRRDHTCF